MDLTGTRPAHRLRQRPAHHWTRGDTNGSTDRDNYENTNQNDTDTDADTTTGTPN